MAKIRTLVKIEKQSTYSTGTTLTCTGTGSVLEGCTGTVWAVPVQFCYCITYTGTGSKVYRYRFRNLPRNGNFTIFQAFFFHNSLLLHPLSKTNMESLKTTSPILLISQRIQGFIPKFTQFYKILELGRIPYLLIINQGFSTKLPINLELGCLPNKTLDKGTNLMSKENPSNPYPSRFLDKILPKSIQRSCIHTNLYKVPYDPY